MKYLAIVYYCMHREDVGCLISNILCNVDMVASRYTIVEYCDINLS
jgi:hypothetical protein